MATATMGNAVVYRPNCDLTKGGRTTGNYLQPNKYVNYSQNSCCALVSASLTEFLDAPCAVDAIAAYISSTILYDHLKAHTVKIGYLPSADIALTTRKGICFDIASLFACMCRSVGIPCKLNIGHADAEYHAWNEVLLNGEWVWYDITATITGLKYVVYKTERVY